jgi:hypothetical protein
MQKFFISCRSDTVLLQIVCHTYICAHLLTGIPSQTAGMNQLIAPSPSGELSSDGYDRTLSANLFPLTGVTDRNSVFRTDPSIAISSKVSA